MTATPILESQLYQAYNPNILTAFMMFAESHSWTVSAGSGSASHQDIYGSRALRIQSSVSSGITINSGGTETQFTVAEDGNYILSFRKLEANLGTATNSVGTTVKMFVNGVPTDIIFYTETEDDQKDIFKTYFAVVQLAASDVVSFGFSVGTSDVGTTYRQYIKEMKLERDVFGFGIPTPYTQPQTIPVAPLTDGLYALRVASGVATWESIE